MQNFWLISYYMQLWLFILYVISLWNFLHIISVCDVCHFIISFLHQSQSIMFIFSSSALITAVVQFVYFLLKYKLIISLWHLSDKTNFVIINLFSISSYSDYYCVSSFFISIIKFTVFFSHSVCLNFCMKLIILYSILTCSMNMIFK